MLRQHPRFKMGEVELWVRYHQGKHVCQCGCTEKVLIKKHHAQKGIPQFLPNHRLPGYRNRTQSPLGTIPPDAPRKYPCGHQRTVANSYFNAGGDRYRCRICTNDKSKKAPWRRSKRGRMLHAMTSKRRLLELKLEMIAGYGGCCSCCGESHPDFLTLEHLFRDGNKERQECKGNTSTLWYRLKKAGWPKDRHTVLCWNCNMARRFGDECPHKRAPLHSSL